MKADWNRFFTPSVVVTLIIAFCTAGGYFIRYYADNEARAADQAAVVEELQQADDRYERQLDEMNRRWRNALAAQERRTEKRFDQLKEEMSSVRKLLEQIAFNTKAANR